MLGLVGIRTGLSVLIATIAPTVAHGVGLPAARWLLVAGLTLAIAALSGATGLSISKPRGRVRLASRSA